MKPLKFPAILGRDASGEVTKVGREVTGFRPGDRVMGLVDGSYAEPVTAAADAWAKVPDTLDLRDAAALPLVTLTGAQLIEEEINVLPKQAVLVTGAVGGVGRAAVYAAKARQKISSRRHTRSSEGRRARRRSALDLVIM